MRGRTWKTLSVCWLMSWSIMTELDCCWDGDDGRWCCCEWWCDVEVPAPHKSDWWCPADGDFLLIGPWPVIYINIKEIIHFKKRKKKRKRRNESSTKADERNLQYSANQSHAETKEKLLIIGFLMLYSCCCHIQNVIQVQLIPILRMRKLLSYM